MSEEDNKELGQVHRAAKERQEWSLDWNPLLSDSDPCSFYHPKPYSGQIPDNLVSLSLPFPVGTHLWAWPNSEAPGGGLYSREKNPDSQVLMHDFWGKPWIHRVQPLITIPCVQAHTHSQAWKLRLPFCTFSASSITRSLPAHLVKLENLFRVRIASTVCLCCVIYSFWEDLLNTYYMAGPGQTCGCQIGGVSRADPSLPSWSLCFGAELWVCAWGTETWEG